MDSEPASKDSSKLSQKRFINVLYENQPVEIDIGSMERFSEVQKEILLAFKEITVGYARVQLWNKTATPHIQFDNLDEIKDLPEEYYWEPKKSGALFLTAQLFPSPPVSSEDTISLSVQGSVFVLKRKTIVSFDWMVARMITSSIPSSKHNDMVYIDVDSTSFRMILSILQGLTDLKVEVSRISTMELTVLKATAAYLLCDNIVQELEVFETEIQKLAADRDKLASQLAESKKSDDFHIIEAIKELPISLIECKGFRSCRSYNTCAAKTLVIGSNVNCIGDSMVCTGCENNIQRRTHYLGAERQYSIRSVVGMKDLANITRNIND
jgi:hypothetical protein